MVTDYVSKQICRVETKHRAIEEYRGGHDESSVELRVHELNHDHENELPESALSCQLTTSDAGAERGLQVPGESHGHEQLLGNILFRRVALVHRFAAKGDEFCPGVRKYYFTSF